jgi:FMN-dependent NADH-azoreductase
MRTLYRVDSSIQGDRSVTHEITDTLERAWRVAVPDGEIIRRDLLNTPLSPAVWTDALAARDTEEPTLEQQHAVDLAAELVGDLLAADAIVIGAPLYNWGPSGHIKCWIDMLWTDPRFAPRTYPLRDKPIALVVTRGGGASPGTPQQGWDHSLPYLLHTFGPDVFGGNITLIETELTLADHSPAMAHLRHKANELRAQSHALAKRTGTALAKRAG